MRADRLNLTITIIFFTFFVLVVLVVYRKWKKTTKVVKIFRSKICDIVPQMSHPHYVDLSYSLLGHPPPPTKRILKGKMETEFNMEMAKNLISAVMSTCNIYNKFDPQLPDYIKHIGKVGEHGSLYQMKGMNPPVQILAFRGTQSKRDILTDFDFTQTLFKGNGFISSNKNKALVHHGFYNLWLSHKDPLEAMAKEIKDGTLYVTGHSLGSALATYSALDLKYRLPNVNVVLYVFAPPRVGNDVFMDILEKAIPHHWAHINVRDVVCELPPSNCPTFTATYLYDDYRNIYRSDYQSGEIVTNHHLETYAHCLNNVKTDPSPVWNRPSMIIRTPLIKE